MKLGPFNKTEEPSRKDRLRAVEKSSQSAKDAAERLREAILKATTERQDNAR